MPELRAPRGQDAGLTEHRGSRHQGSVVVVMGWDGRPGS